MTREQKNQLWRIPLVCMGLAGIIYSLIFIFSGSIPVVNKLVFDIGKGENLEYQLPFSISRLWDILFIGIIVFSLQLILIKIYYFHQAIYRLYNRPIDNFFIGIGFLLFLSACACLIEGIATFFTFFLVFILLGMFVVFFVAMDKYNRWEYNLLLSLATGCMAGFFLGLNTGLPIGAIISISIFILYFLVSSFGLIIRNIVLTISSSIQFLRSWEKVKRVVVVSINFMYGK